MLRITFDRLFRFTLFDEVGGDSRCSGQSILDGVKTRKNVNHLTVPGGLG